MSSGPSTVTAQDAGPAVHLSTTDKYLPVWIGAAMVTGLLLGRLVPGLDSWLGAVEIDGVDVVIRPPDEPLWRGGAADSRCRSPWGCW